MDQFIWFFLTSSPDAKTNSIDSMQISLTPGIDIKQKPDELSYIVQPEMDPPKNQDLNPFEV